MKIKIKIERAHGIYLQMVSFIELLHVCFRCLCACNPPINKADRLVVKYDGVAENVAAQHNKQRGDQVL